jgi:hypothetical protein
MLRVFKSVSNYSAATSANPLVHRIFLNKALVKQNVPTFRPLISVVEAVAGALADFLNLDKALSLSKLNN